MKGKILASLKGKAEIIEQYDAGEIFAVHFTMPGESSWNDGVHGYIVIKGDHPVAKNYSTGAGTADRPDTLDEYIHLQRECGNL